MKTPVRHAWILGLLSLSCVMGCASAYHSYSDCQVPCRYCPLPPLPYVSYPACACHSNAAMQHLSVPVSHVVPAEIPQTYAPPAEPPKPSPPAKESAADSDEQP